MEAKGKIVNRKDNQSRTTYILQLEVALRNASQDKRILMTAIEHLVKENAQLKVENEQLRTKAA